MACFLLSLSALLLPLFALFLFLHKWLPEGIDLLVRFQLNAIRHSRLDERPALFVWWQYWPEVAFEFAFELLDLVQRVGGTWTADDIIQGGGLELCLRPRKVLRFWLVVLGYRLFHRLIQLQRRLLCHRRANKRKLLLFQSGRGCFEYFFLRWCLKRFVLMMHAHHLADKAWRSLLTKNPRRMHFNLIW